MSATATPAFTTEQVDAIIAEALNSDPPMFERGPDGQLPEDPEDRLAAATELVRASRLAYRAGNRGQGVLSLLHISEDDLKALESERSKTEGAKSTVSATEQEQLAQQSDVMIQRLYETLANYEQSEEVLQNVALVKAEMERRGLQAPDASAGNGQMTVTKEVLGPDQTDSFLPQDGAASPVDRKALEDRLTFAMMRNHGVDPSEVEALSDSALQWIIEHPGGDKPAEQQEAKPVREDGETIETTRVVTERAPEPQPQIARKEGLEVGPDSSPSQPSISSDRLKMEEQITGSTLKAYGSGRKQVADGTVGDNELQFMLDHPDGKVTLEQLEAARALDRGEAVAQPQAVQEEPQTVADQNRAQKAAAKTADQAFSPPVPEQPAEPQPEPVQEAPAPSPAPPPAPVAQDLPAQPIDPAQDIIAANNLPIPPEIESTPRLPFDLSKCPDDEIFSYHSQFHACHVRANYLVGLWESELRDEVKLRKGREVAVMNDLPIKDGRTKLTDAQREAMVQADPEVISHREREHGIEKKLRQLKVLQGNYSSDVSTCSRQMERRRRELEGSKS